MLLLVDSAVVAALASQTFDIEDGVRHDTLHACYTVVVGSGLWALLVWVGLLLLPLFGVFRQRYAVVLEVGGVSPSFHLFLGPYEPVQVGVEQVIGSGIPALLGFHVEECTARAG